MTPELYAHIQAVFLRVRELAVAQRADALSSEDAVVQSEVQSLLECEQACDQFLEPDQPPPNSTTQPIEHHHLQLKAIGPYQLLQQIGEGGQGSVYMAEQREPINRKVAVKLIKPGMDSKQILARFHAERQALAMMDHPSIARVFDAGSTDSGEPFFVMELVRGIPIDQFCENNAATLDERLGLFLQVCRAVNHAHQKGIIHRDIKPGNVLVTLAEEGPLAKVIDFGIAKALEGRLTSQTLFTEYGQMVGTLEYMSPEQAEMSAVDIDTRSDIYSLGVLLFRLLTGESPITREQLLKKGIFEFPRLIRETEPEIPSARITARHHQRAAIDRNPSERPNATLGIPHLPPGDLDWIVLKALAKDRRQRYESALDFARDLQRYLNGEAVEAHPPSLLYKSSRLLARHRTIVMTGCIVMFGVLIGVAGLGWGLQRSLRAERATRQAASELAANVYTDLVQAAWKAADKHDYARATRLLEACPKELRGWEWRLTKGQLDQPRFQTLRSSERSAIRAMQLDKSERLLAAVFSDGRVEVWNLADNQNLYNVNRPIDAIALDFSNQASKLIVGTGQGSISVFRTDTWESKTRTLGLGAIYDVTTSPDGQYFAVCTGAGWAVVLDVHTLETVRQWKLGSRAASVAYMGSDSLVAAGLDGRAYVVRYDRDKNDAFLVSESSLSELCVLDASRVVTLTSGRAIAVDLLEHKPTPQSLVVSRAVASALACDSQGNVWVGCGNGNLLISLRHQQHLVADFGTAITNVQLLGDGTQLLVALSDGRLLRGQAQQPGPPEPTDEPQAVRTIPHPLAPDSREVVVGDDNGWLRRLNASTGQVLSEKRAHLGGIWDCSVDRDQNIVATVGDDRYLRCWDLPDFKLRFEHPIDFGVRSVIVSPDGTWIAAAPAKQADHVYAEGTIAIWEVASGAVVRTLTGHQNWVLAFAVSADGSQLVSTCEDRETRIWHRPTGKLSALIVPDNKSPAEKLAIDDQNETLYLGHRDGWISSWIMRDGAPSATWPAFGDVVSGLALTADGRVIATSRSDERLQITDRTMNKRLGEFDLRAGYISTSRLAADDQTLLVIGPSGRLNRFAIAPSPE